MTDNKNIKPLAEMALIGEIASQSKFAAMAAEHLAKSSDPDEVWGAIQSILVATANVSKILWPVRKKSKARGKYLRKLLSVNENNLLSDRTIRNHFEHYDERIEDWFDRNNSVVYMDSRIDPFEPTPFSLPQLFHRSYNPTTQILTFRDETVDLSAVLSALAEIRGKCKYFTLVARVGTPIT